MFSTNDRRRRPAEAPVLETLEERVLLTTLFGGDVFEFQDASEQTIRVVLTGDIIAEFIAADINQSDNSLVLGDIPGYFLASALGLTGTEILGGWGGADGVTPIGLTPIYDPLFGPGNFTNFADDNVPPNVNLHALASMDAMGNGATYAFNLATVEIGGEERQIVQLVELDIDTGRGDVQAMLHQASLNEDVMTMLSVAVPRIDALSVDPTTGLAYAIGSRLGPTGVMLSYLFRINRLTGTVDEIGAVTNTSHLGTPNQGALSNIQAMAFNAMGQMFILTSEFDGDPTGDVGGDGSDTALVAVNKTTGLFTDDEVMTLRDVNMPGDNRVVATYTAMAFNSAGELYASTLGGMLHRIDMAPAPYPATTTLQATGVLHVADDETPVSVVGLAFARDVADREILVGVHHSDEGPWLVDINPVGGVAEPLSPAGSIRGVYDLACYIEPGDTRPLLFGISGQQLIRGSAVTLPVDENGLSVASAIDAADFRPRTGSTLDGLLYLVGRDSVGEEEADRLYTIDVNPLSRSAIQNTLTHRGLLSADDEVHVSSIAWEQTAVDAAELTLLQINDDTAWLVDVGFVPATGMAVLGASTEVTLVVDGDPQDVSGITGIEFVSDDPLVVEPYIWAVLNIGDSSLLIRIDRGNGLGYVLGPLPDPDFAEDEDYEGPIPGADIQGLAWNPVIYNPFTGQYGVLLATDAASDRLLILDDRPRFPTADVFAIYVSHAAENASIAMAQVQAPDADPPRFMLPFDDPAGQVRVRPAQDGDLIVIPAGGLGTVWLGARTEDIDPDVDDEDLRPVIRALVPGIGVRPAGVDDWPGEPVNLASGLRVAEELLAFLDNEPGLVNHVLGLNVDQVRAMAISRSGQIFLVDTDGVDEFGNPVSQDHIIQVDPATGLAFSAVPLMSGQTALRGVQGLAYADVNGDGVEELYAIVSLPSYVPVERVRQPLVGDVFGERATALTVTPGGVLYAVAENLAGRHDLYLIDRPANGTILAGPPREITEVLSDGTTYAVRDVLALEAHPRTGALYAIGRDNDGDQALYWINTVPMDLVLGDGDMEVMATKIGKLDNGGVDDPFTALAFEPGGQVLYAVQRRAQGAFLHTVNTVTADLVDVIGGTLGSGEIRVAEENNPLDIREMDFDANGNLIAIDRGPAAGTGRLVRIDRADPGASIAVNTADSISALMVGYASDRDGLFYTINMAGPMQDDEILVSPGDVPTLGTVTLTLEPISPSYPDVLALTSATFTPLGIIDPNMVKQVRAMAFSPREGSLPGKPGLYVIDVDNRLFEIDPLTGEPLTTGDLVRGLGPDGLYAAFPIGSIAFDELGRLFGHDLYNGRLVDLNLGDLRSGVIRAGGQTATTIGSMRPTVGAFAYDATRDCFLAVDNATGMHVATDEGFARDSSMLMRLLGAESGSAVGQNMNKVLIGGVVTGKVNTSGSFGTFYAGWLITGEAFGLLESESILDPNLDGWHIPNNFYVAGDIRDLVVTGSIGTNNDNGRDDPEYYTGFDMHVGGKVGQVLTLADYIGSLDVENDTDIHNLPDTAFPYQPDFIYRHELEYRNIIGKPDDIPAQGWLFERFELFNDTSFLNDTFDTAQYVGSVRSGTPGEPDVVRIVGTLNGEDQAGGNDYVDYFGVALMAGQSVWVQLLTGSAASNVDAGMVESYVYIGVFDPDGRLVATDVSDVDRWAVWNQPFLFTAERPGVYRFAVGGIDEDELFTNEVEVAATAYQITIWGAGDIGLGGLVVGARMFNPAYIDPDDPTRDTTARLRVRRGDLGAVLVPNEFISVNFEDARVDTGNLRSVVSGQLGILEPVGNGLDFNVGGSVGRIQTTVGFFYLNVLAAGGDVQLLESFDDMIFELYADGGLGIVRVGGDLGVIDIGSTRHGWFTHCISVDTDGYGQDGIIDLIDVTGDLGSMEFAGPPITTGSGGNVRYIRVGGLVFRDPYFGFPSPDGDHVDLPPGQTAIVRDDSGGEIFLEPLSDQVDELGNPRGFDPITHQPFVGTLTYRTYGIQGSGGSVLIDVTSTGGLRVTGNAFGNGSPVEIGGIQVDGVGREVIVTPGIPDLVNHRPVPGVMTLAPDAGFNLLVDIVGASPIDVYEVVGGNFTRIANTTGGELVGAEALSIGRLVAKGSIGVPVNHTGAAIDGLAVVADAYPYKLQKFGIVSGSIIEAHAGGAVGNFILSGSLGELVANVGGVVDHSDGVFRGVAGPILATGDINYVMIGEGVAPTGNGAVARAGLYAEGVIFLVTNQGLGSDIHGNIVGQNGIQRIILRDGSIINANIENVLIPHSVEWPYVTVAGGSIIAISLGGRGGIIGTLFSGADLGNTTVAGGFGILNSVYAFSTFNGRLGNVTADGYGVRAVSFVGGITMDNLTATGNGSLLDVGDYSPTVRYSPLLQSDPVFGVEITRLSDLYLFLGLSVADPIIEGISESGIIERVYIGVNKSVGTIRSFRLQASLFAAADTITGVIVTEDIRDGLEITTGRLGIFRPGGDVYGLNMTIAGRIDRIDIRGDLLANSFIEASGPNGDILYLRVAGNMDGSLLASGKVGTIIIGGDLTGNITIQATNRARLALSLLRVGGSLAQGSLDIFGDVGAIDVAGSLGSPGDDVLIRGNLGSLRVGTSPVIDGSTMALDLSITGNLGSAMIAGRSIGDIFVGGNVNRLSVTADPWTRGGTLLDGQVDVLGELRGLTITNGDVSADVTAGGGIGSAIITNGSLAAGGSITSAYGNIGTVFIRTGDLLGDVRAPDGTISSIIVVGSDLGALGLVQAKALRVFRLDGSMLPGATVDVAGDLGMLQVGGHIHAGATVRAGSAPIIIVGGDALGLMILGICGRGTRLNVGADLGGVIRVDGDATVMARGDMRDESTLVVGGDMPQFIVDGIVRGTVVVDRAGGTFRLGGLYNAVLTTGFDLQRLQLAGDALYSLIQVGVTRGAPLPANQPPSEPPVVDDGDVDVDVLPLNPYQRKLDGQWLGSYTASDGKVYFASGTHAHDASSMFFQYNPATGVLSVLSDDISEICGENASVDVPQGKIHSPIVETGGWIYFTTHLANYWDQAVEDYTGAHLVGYRLGSLEQGEPEFRDFGIPMLHYTSYAAVAADPNGGYLWSVYTPWRPQDVDVSGSHLVRTNIATGEHQDFGPIDADEDGSQTAFFIHVDARGDAWVSINNSLDKFYVARAATGQMEAFDHALPTMSHLYQKGIDSPYQDSSWIAWGQSIDAERAIFTMIDIGAPADLCAGGSLYEFDAGKAVDGNLTDAFRELAWIGGSGLSLDYDDGMVWFVRRGDGSYVAKIDGSDDNGQTWDPALDTGVRLHLYGVDVRQADPEVVDYGPIVDADGRFPWRIESLTADDAQVFMVGDWIWNDDDPEEYRSLRRALDEAPSPGNPYLTFIRGQVFLVADLAGGTGDDEAEQDAGVEQLFGTGSIEETGRIAKLGTFMVGGRMGNTIVAVGGDVGMVTVQGGMDWSSISSGLVLGGSAIQDAIDDATPLASAAELDGARGAHDRQLFRGNLGTVTVNYPWLVGSALTAGVDPGDDGAFGTHDDNVSRSLTGGISRFTGAINTFLDANSFLLADASGSGVDDIIDYTFDDDPVHSITLGNPLEALVATASAGSPVTLGAGLRTVQVRLTGPGTADIHDDNGGDSIIDTLVIRNGTSRTTVEIVTDAPGEVSIGRLLTQDDTTVGRFRFDGDLVGDGCDTVDLWIDGPVNELSVRDLGDEDWTGRIGDDVATISIRNLGSAKLHVGGAVRTFRAAGSDADPLLRTLGPATSADIRTMAADSAGNVWVFDAVTGKLSKVDPVQGQELASATVTDVFTDGAVTLTAMDFAGGDVLLAVATVFDLSPTRPIGAIHGADIDLTALAVARDGRLLAIEQAAYVSMGALGGQYDITAMVVNADGTLLAVNDTGVTLTLHRIVRDGLDQVADFRTIGTIRLGADPVRHVNAMSYDAANGRILAVGTVPAQSGQQLVLLSIDAATATAIRLTALRNADNSIISYVAPDPDNPLVINDDVKGLVAPASGGAPLVLRNTGGVDRLFRLNTGTGVLTEVVGATLGTGEVRVDALAVDLLGLAADADGNIISLDRLTDRTVRLWVNDPALSFAIDEAGAVPDGAAAFTTNAAGVLYLADTSQPDRPMFRNIGRDRLVSLNRLTGARQPIGPLNSLAYGQGFFADVLSLAFDDNGKLYGLLRDRDGVGSMNAGVALVSIATTANASGTVTVTGPTTGAAGVLLGGGGVTNNFPALSVDRNGMIWAIRRSLDDTQDELVTIALDATVTLVNTVRVDGENTRIVGMGFTEGNKLVAYSVVNGQADLIAVDKVNPPLSRRVSDTAGTLSPDVDAFAIGRSGANFPSFAYDTDGDGGTLYTNAGLSTALGKVNTTTGEFTRFQSLTQDAQGTPLSAPVVDIAVDPCDPGHVYAVTADSRLLEYSQTTGAFIRLAGTVTDRQTGLVLSITQIEFDDAGRLLGIDARLDRLVVIGTADAAAAALMDTASLAGDDIVAFTFDPATGTLLGARDSDDRFVAFRAADARGLTGVTACSFNQVTIGGGDGFDGRLVTTGNSINMVTVAGDFGGTLVSAGAIRRYMQTGGDLRGAIRAAKNIAFVSITGGDFAPGASIVAARDLGNFTLTGGDFGGLVFACSAGIINVTGAGLATADIVVTEKVRQVRFTGGYDGTMRLGGAYGIIIGGQVGDQGVIELLGPLGIFQAGGTADTALILVDDSARMITLSDVHRGMVAVRRGATSVRVQDAQDALLIVGNDLGSLTVLGTADGSLFSVGTWIGDDRLYNTDDDLIVGGTLRTGTFRKKFINSVVAAGVLPDPLQGPGLPADLRGFTGNAGAADVAVIDPAQAGGPRASALGSLIFIDEVISTSPATGRLSSVVAAGPIGRILQRRGGAALTRRVYNDPFGPPTVLDVQMPNDTDLVVYFSEPIPTGALILSQDADDDGDLDSPVDVRGTILLTANGRIIDDVTLDYTTVTGSTGRTYGVLLISRATAFEQLLTLHLSGKLTAPTIFDRSGPRSALRDLNRDGLAAIGEDAAGTILDGGADGTEGGGFTKVFGDTDNASVPDESSFENAPLIPLNVDDGVTQIDGEFNLMRVDPSINWLDRMRGDMDIYRFNAHAYQFLSIGATLTTHWAGMALGLFWLDDQGTPQTADDRYEVMARWEVNAVDDGPTGLSFLTSAMYQAFELPEDGQYALIIYSNAMAIDYSDITGNAGYRVQLTLASSDDVLDGSLDGAFYPRTGEQIAYVSNRIGDHNNLVGANTPKHLVYLNFDGGVTSDYRDAIDEDILVLAMDPTLLDEDFEGMEDTLINGDGEEFAGVVERIMSIYRDTPESLPQGRINVQRVETLAQWLSATSGLFFTTVDPATWGLDPQADFGTVFIGQTDDYSPLGPGLYGLASTIDIAGQSHSDDAIVFVQNFAGVLTAEALDERLNQAANLLANIAAHELGHALGLNHQPTDWSNYALLSDDPDNNPLTPDDSNTGTALMAYAPDSVVMSELRQLGTAELAPAEFPTGYVDTVDLLIRWLM